MTSLSSSRSSSSRLNKFNLIFIVIEIMTRLWLLNARLREGNKINRKKNKIIFIYLFPVRFLLWEINAGAKIISSFFLRLSYYSLLSSSSSSWLRFFFVKEREIFLVRNFCDFSITTFMRTSKNIHVEV